MSPHDTYANWEERPHDREASGSGSQTQPDYGIEFAASFFGTPPPVPTVSRDKDVWDTAKRISTEAEAWPRERRVNAGVQAERWSPSPFQQYRG